MKTWGLLSILWMGCQATALPGPDEPTVPELDVDETIPPRPEDEIADILRAKPDVEYHSRHSQ